jgi:hypothetical protein
MTYACPVCDYQQLRNKPYEIWPPPVDLDISPPYEDFLGKPSYEVCLRCGFEFGNDDNPGTAPSVSFDEYRSEWESEGST